MAQRSIARTLWYNALHAASRLASVLLLGMRVSGRSHVPRQGGLLVCANHQSHFDPVLVGLALDRRLNYLARDTLFRFAPLRWLIQSLDAIPIDREGLGLSGIKETLRRLKRGEAVLIFPEGTRTIDGHVAPLKPGFVALARRGRVPLLPVGIDGAFAAWPRTQVLPRMETIHVAIGQPMTPQLVNQLSDQQLLEELGRRLHDCQAQAKAGRLRAAQSELLRCVPATGETVAIERRATG
jgi:1-acyl-sn-glycerol-3-phosphate acyltransferase